MGKSLYSKAGYSRQGLEKFWKAERAPRNIRHPSATSSAFRHAICSIVAQGCGLRLGAEVRYVGRIRSVHLDGEIARWTEAGPDIGGEGGDGKLDLVEAAADHPGVTRNEVS